MTTAPSPTPSIADIERWGRLTMPASARDIQAYVDTLGLDPLVVLSFKLPPGDLSSFLAGAGYPTSLQPLEFAVDIPGYYSEFDRELPGRPGAPGLSWWPSMADWDRMLEDEGRVLMYAEVIEFDFGRSILVDQGNPELYTVFLVHS